MPITVVDAQSLEKDHRSAEGHLKGSTKEQLVNQLHREPNLNVSLQTHVASGVNKRS